MHTSYRTSPCFAGCPDREPACHSKCERYILWRKEFDKKQEKIRAERFDDGLKKTWDLGK